MNNNIKNNNNNNINNNNNNEKKNFKKFYYIPFSDRKLLGFFYFVPDGSHKVSVKTHKNTHKNTHNTHNNTHKNTHNSLIQNMIFAALRHNSNVLSLNSYKHVCFLMNHGNLKFTLELHNKQYDIEISSKPSFISSINPVSLDRVFFSRKFDKNNHWVPFYENISLLKTKFNSKWSKYNKLLLKLNTNELYNLFQTAQVNNYTLKNILKKNYNKKNFFLDKYPNNLKNNQKMNKYYVINNYGVFHSAHKQPNQENQGPNLNPTKPSVQNSTKPSVQNPTKPNYQTNSKNQGSNQPKKTKKQFQTVREKIQGNYLPYEKEFKENVKQIIKIIKEIKEIKGINNINKQKINNLDKFIISNNRDSIIQYQKLFNCLLKNNDMTLEIFEIIRRVNTKSSFLKFFNFYIDYLLNDDSIVKISYSFYNWLQNKI